MLALGKALTLKPRLLVLNKPSLRLSLNFMEIVFDKIGEINRDVTTILFVEQNARLALAYADRASVFEMGKIAMEDKAKDLFANDEIKEAFLSA